MELSRQPAENARLKMELEILENRPRVCPRPIGIETSSTYRRSDGLWDIEGHPLDTRNYDMAFYDCRALTTGDALYEMRLRITLDREFVIRAAEAITLHAPYPACPAIASAYQQLVGLRIRPGFNQKLRELF